MVLHFPDGETEAQKSYYLVIPQLAWLTARIGSPAVWLPSPRAQSV